MLARDIDIGKANLLYAQQQFNRTAQLTANGFSPSTVWRGGGMRIMRSPTKRTSRT
jgi:hypothetical protein